MSELNFDRRVADLTDGDLGRAVVIASADGDFLAAGILTAGAPWHYRDDFASDLYGFEVSTKFHLVPRVDVGDVTGVDNYVLAMDDRVALL